jgi:hypothetical protein
MVTTRALGSRGKAERHQVKTARPPPEGVNPGRVLLSTLQGEGAGYVNESSWAKAAWNLLSW